MTSLKNEVFALKSIIKVFDHSKQADENALCANNVDPFLDVDGGGFFFSFEFGCKEHSKFHHSNGIYPRWSQQSSMGCNQKEGKKEL